MARLSNGVKVKANDNFRWKLPHFFVRLDNMKKLQPDDQIIKIDEKLGIAWILLPPDKTLGGFQGISPRVMNEEKFLSAKNKAPEKKD